MTMWTMVVGSVHPYVDDGSAAGGKEYRQQGWKKRRISSLTVFSCRQMWLIDFFYSQSPPPVQLHALIRQAEQHTQLATRRVGRQ